MYLTSQERQADERAQEIIQQHGQDGYKVAAELVGPDRADAILHNHIWWQIKNSGRRPNEKETVAKVREVRRLNGFSPRPQFEQLRISPPVWPSKVKVQLGDFSQFVPYGNGAYGYQSGERSNPFLLAPEYEPSGGLIFFGNEMGSRELRVFFRVLEINPDDKCYVAFVSSSEQPGKEGYLTQIRIITRFGLRFFFEAISDQEYDSFPEQEVTACEALWSFMSKERNRWGTSFFEDRGLAGLFGGDEDSAREQLAFGFSLENQYYGIYRMWSRAWLVTK